MSRLLRRRWQGIAMDLLWLLLVLPKQRRFRLVAVMVPQVLRAQSQNLSTNRMRIKVMKRSRTNWRKCSPASRNRCRPVPSLRRPLPPERGRKNPPRGSTLQRVNLPPPTFSPSWPVAKRNPNRRRLHLRRRRPEVATHRKRRRRHRLSRTLNRAQVERRKRYSLRRRNGLMRGKPELRRTSERRF